MRIGPPRFRNFVNYRVPFRDLMASFAFSLKPLEEVDFPAAAEFLAKYASAEAGAEVPGRVAELGEAAKRLSNLRWRLLQNPWREITAELGYVLVDNAGCIAGMLLIHPWRFRLGDRTLRAAGSGSFYVAPSARGLGFLLFKRLLKLSGLDFLFANTCNRQSGMLWAKFGAVPVPESDREFFLPLRSAPLLREALAQRGATRPLAWFAGLVGPTVDLMFSGRLGRRAVRIEPCEDWQELARIAELNRRRDHIVSDRSAEYLRWTYGQTQAEEAPQLFLIHGRKGVGWFSIGRDRRGRNHNVRCTRLLDVAVSEDVEARAVFAGAVQGSWSSSDLVSCQGRIDIGMGDIHELRLRRFAGPVAYLKHLGQGANIDHNRWVLAQADGL